MIESNLTEQITGGAIANLHETNRMQDWPTHQFQCSCTKAGNQKDGFMKFFRLFSSSPCLRGESSHRPAKIKHERT